ncbi:hypothetical protein [Nocardia sp. NPDC003183]
MAKRRLRKPDVPAGARLSFFLYLQRLVTERGDKSTSELGKLAGYSHQSVYKALTGPRMPSRAMTEALVQALAGQPEVDTVMGLWSLGVHEERNFQEGPADHEAPPIRREKPPVVLPTGPPPSTKLDRTRAAATARSPVAEPPQKPYLQFIDALDNSDVAIENYTRRLTLAHCIWSCVHSAGVTPEMFESESTRTGLPGWMAAETMPNRQQLLNFVYELRPEEDVRDALMAAYANAVAEQQEFRRAEQFRPRLSFEPSAEGIDSSRRVRAERLAWSLGIRWRDGL